MFGLIDIRKFSKNLLYKSQYGITEDECIRGIQTACDFFGIPMPRAIQDLTDDPQGATMLRPFSPDSLTDDVLCYDLKELKRLGVNDYVGFTAVFTHECAHRIFQNRLLPGVDFGPWESELVADFFMGVRASLERQNITIVKNELAKHSHGSGTHPIGKLRWEYITYGQQEGNFHLIHRQSFNAEEYFQCFLEYRQNHLEELRKAELKVY